MRYLPTSYSISSQKKRSYRGVTDKDWQIAIIQDLIVPNNIIIVIILLVVCVCTVIVPSNPCNWSIMQLQDLFSISPGYPTSSYCSITSTLKEKKKTMLTNKVKNGQLRLGTFHIHSAPTSLQATCRAWFDPPSLKIRKLKKNCLKKCPVMTPRQWNKISLAVQKAESLTVSKQGLSANKDLTLIS